MAARSFRFKLLLWTGLSFFLAVYGVGAALVWVSGRATEKLFDEALMEMARVAAEGPNPLRHREEPRRGEPFGLGEPPLGRRGPDQDRTQDGLPLKSPRFVGVAPDGALVGEGWDDALARAALKKGAFVGDSQGEGKVLRVASVPVRGRQGRVLGVVQTADDPASLALGRQAQQNTLLLAAPVCLVLVALLAKALSDQVLRPVGRATELARAIAADPGAGVRLPVEGDDEMAQMAGAFNKMTDGLQASNRRLAEALEAQRRFTADASHELRTPLTRITLAAENGAGENVDPEGRKTALETVKRSAASMRRLIEGLLALSRSDTGRLELELGPVKLKQAAVEAVAEAGLAADPRVSVEGAEVTVGADSDALRRILVNLLENATRVTPPEGSVTIAVEAVGPRLTVTDTGPGVAPEHRERIFDRFFRADESRSRASGGNGLGLAIARELAQAMAAKLYLMPGTGPGATFCIDFSPSDPSSQDSNSEIV
ncbi:MAG: HAMP domain-containing histidine kinase [Fimbriimonadaceae bacterium]|nr:HAMP domain-containing histidine kinase [Fimbriimonadaceae bacterium]QYK54800.1 MAG: HAMP domain-containing histidine kinase [Fimbriimonadaceae bacterium]